MAENNSVRQLIEELSNAALRDLLRNVRHHTELRRRIAAGLIDERAVNQAYREYAQREGPAYRQQAADLTLQYYSDLTDLGNRYSEQFYAEVLDNAAAMAGADGHGGRPDGGRATTLVDEAEAEAVTEEVPLELHGPPGREVVARFGLQNTEDHPVALTLDVGPCRGPDGAPFLAPLTVQPARLELQPGESHQVTLRLVMLPSVFTPGFLYRLPVTVRGADVLRLVLTIWAEEPDTGLRIDDSGPFREPVTPPASEAAPPPSSPARPAEAPGAEDRASAATAFVVVCPSCRREFPRSRRSERLYAHKTPAGEPCPTRTGQVRTA